MAAIIVMMCNKSKEQKAREAQEHAELMARWEALTPVGRRKKEQQEALRKVLTDYAAKIDTTLLKYDKCRKLFALGYVAFLTCMPTQALAAGSGANGGVALIKLMQQASFWVGIGVVVWGIIEAQLDLPSWKGRIFKGILGYVAILLVPILFMSLRDNLQIDVWNELIK